MLKLRDAFGVVLRSLRENAGMSQERLAQKAKVSRNFVGNVERGESSLSLEAADRLARALHVTLPDLLRRVENLRV